MLNLLILCGGRATRLQGVNSGVPKCLVDVNGISLLSNLILSLSELPVQIFISTHRNVDKISQCLNSELDSSLASNVQFFEDEEQIGTANAILKFWRVHPGNLLVMNGDTIFSKARLCLPMEIEKGSVVFYTSSQAVGRSGHLKQIPSTGHVFYEKHRLLSFDNVGDVSNGIIGLHQSVFKTLSQVQCATGASIEDLVFDCQNNGLLKLSLQKTNLNFLDVGSVDTYINIKQKYSEMVLSK